MSTTVTVAGYPLGLHLIVDTTRDAAALLVARMAAAGHPVEVAYDEEEQ